MCCRAIFNETNNRKKQKKVIKYVELLEGDADGDTDSDSDGDTDSDSDSNSNGDLESDQNKKDKINDSGTNVGAKKIPSTNTNDNQLLYSVVGLGLISIGIRFYQRKCSP